MLKLLQLVILVVVAVVNCQRDDTATNQLADFKNKTMAFPGIITTGAGAPVTLTAARSTLNTNLLSNQYFMDALTLSVRERIPERVVHAPGAGAFGYFEVTHDITHICKAKLFSKIGKKTPVVVRFSITGPRSGIKDTHRESSRGMVVKFYTEEGNLDLPALNTPCFTFKDPILFPHLSHIMKPNPVTNLPDPNMLWDFLTLHPESMYQTIILLSDYGYPRDYRHMAAYPIHTYQVFNETGAIWCVRFHFIPDAGIQYFNSTEAAEIDAGDSYYFARDLCNAIANRNYPSWQLKVQILSTDDVKNAGFDVYDVTNTLPMDLYPLHSVGKITLNQNVENYFSQMEQLAACPGNLVPGILGCPGKLFEARCLAYKEAQTYRLGSNFNKIQVNCPMQAQPYTYYRDGLPPLNDNGRNGPNYYPNSFGGPIAKNISEPTLSSIIEKEPSNYEQANIFYKNDLTSVEKTSLIDNIVKSSSLCVNEIKCRLVKILKIINFDLGSRVATGLAVNCV